MPYHIIKKVKLSGEGSSVYLPTFSIDLEEEKTWHIFKLYREPKPIIRGEVIRLLDFDGYTKELVGKNYEFNTNCQCNYVNVGNDSVQQESNRSLQFPSELVQGYPLDENTAVELLLHEIIYYQKTKNEEKKPLYEIMVEGPKDIIPKDDTTNLIDKKSVEKSLIAYCTECGTSLGRFKNESLRKIKVKLKGILINIELASCNRSCTVNGFRNHSHFPLTHAK